MGVRISELPETTGINKDDLLIVEDGQGTKKGTVQQLDEALGVSQLKEDLDNYIHKPNLGDNNKFPRAKDGSVEWVEQGMPTDEQTSIAINNWLDAHPDATTTVLDGSLTESKFTDTLKLHTLKDYVTPQMYGAKGDGITDDSEAFKSALQSNLPLFVPKGTYIVSNVEVPAYKEIVGSGNYSTIILNKIAGSKTFIFNKDSYYASISNMRIAESIGDSNEHTVSIDIDYTGHSEYPQDINVTIQNMTFGSCNNAIYLHNNARGCSITDCRFEGSKLWAIRCDGTDNFINECDIHNSVNGMLLGSNNLVTNVKIWYIDDLALYINGSHNIITGLSIQNSQNGIDFVDYASSNNICFEMDGNGIFQTGTGHDINLRSNNKNNIIKGCVTAGFNSDGVVVGTKYGLMMHNTCVNNIINLTINNVNGLSEYVYFNNQNNRNVRVNNYIIINNQNISDIYTTVWTSESQTIPNNAENVIIQLRITSNSSTRVLSFPVVTLNETLIYDIKENVGGNEVTAYIRISDYSLSLNDVIGGTINMCILYK